jgi:hypothetical protein
MPDSDEEVLPSPATTQRKMSGGLEKVRKLSRKMNRTVSSAASQPRGLGCSSMLLLLVVLLSVATALIVVSAGLAKSQEAPAAAAAAAMGEAPELLAGTPPEELAAAKRWAAKEEVQGDDAEEEEQQQEGVHGIHNTNRPCQLRDGNGLCLLYSVEGEHAIWADEL